MIIGHYKKTPIAQAPEAISQVINKYTNHYSYVTGYSYPVGKIIPKTDLIHQHNVDTVNHSKKIIQYHSEPFRVDLSTKITKLVIAQYHATLPEYQDCLIVRNPIDIYDEKFFPQYQQDKIRIGYSPSTKKPQSAWADKGYTETTTILNEIKAIYKDKVDIDIITDVNLEECLKRKSLSNIFIDEVKTPSYHRSGLEALAMGITTICSVGKDVEKLLLSSSGSQKMPFKNVYLAELKNFLIKLIAVGLDSILEDGYQSRLWMEKFWNPRVISQEYIYIYESIIL